MNETEELDELKRWLEAALKRIDELEAELEASRRREYFSGLLSH
jgi:hypothetical protein